MKRAMTAVIGRVMNGKIFDEDGWLIIGISGHQPGIGEHYISTGSLYLCCTVFLPLGLPPEDPFWSCEGKKYTQEKIWSGDNIDCDHAEH